MLRRPLSILLTLAILFVTALASVSGAAAQDATPVLGAAPAESGDGVVVNHIQGETTVPSNPDVVFSFDIAAIDTLQALGVEVDGMPELSTGADQYMTDDTQIIGSLFEPDYEAINAAQPDLIIVAGRSSDAYDDLSDIAPTIDLSFSGAGFIEDLATNTNILAEIFGKQDEAAEILGTINDRVASLQAQVADIGTGMVIMTTGGNVTALAPDNARGGRGALVYQTLGIQPPIEDLEAATHGEPISFEFLLEHDPDWLFVIDRDAAIGTEDGQPAEQVLDNELMHETIAWQNDQIVYLNSFDWYIITGGGLDSTQRMLGEMETAFAG